MRVPINNSTHLTRSFRTARRTLLREEQLETQQQNNTSRTERSTTSQPPQLSITSNLTKKNNKMPDRFYHIDPLTYDNFDEWKRSIETIGMRDDHFFYEHLIADVTEPVNATEEQHRSFIISRSSAILAIEQNISPQIKSLLSNDVFHNLSPFKIIQHLKTRIENNPTNNAGLPFNKATSLELHEFEDLQAYLEQHTNIRKKLSNINYPGIENEEMCIDLIIKGLKDPFYGTLRRSMAGKSELRKSLTEFINYLFEFSIDRETYPATPNAPIYQGTAQSGRSNRSLPPFRTSDRQKIYVNKKQQRPPKYTGPWCSYHGSKTHYTRDCNDYTTWKGLPTYRQLTTESTPYNSRRTREYPSNTNRATNNQHEIVDENVTTELNQHRTNEVHNHTKVLIDSCCYPTHLPKPTKSMKLTNNILTSTATGHQSRASHAGPTTLQLGSILVPIDNAISVPNLRTALVSAYQVAQKYDILLRNENLYISEKQSKPPINIIAQGKANNGIYEIDTKQRNSLLHAQINSSRTVPRPRNHQTATSAKTILPQHIQRRSPILPTTSRAPAKISTQLSPPPLPPTSETGDYFHFHRLYNHIELDTLHCMAKMNVPGIPKSLKAPPPPMTCAGCAVGKMKRSPFNKHSPTRHPGESIASDIASWNITSFNGYNHYATFLDEATRYLQVVLLTHKSNISTYIKPLLSSIQLHTNVPIQQFRFDGGGEYNSNNLKQFYDQNSIHAKSTTPHTPQENAKAERINQTLKDRVRSTMAHSNLPPTMWEYALLDTVDKYNHSYHSTTKTIPAAVWHSRDPQNNNLLPFGQYGFVIDATKTKKANQDRSRLAQYIGRHDLNHYKVYLVHTNRVTKVRTKDFQTYSPYYDPESYVTTATNFNTQISQTEKQKPTTNNPSSLKQARNSPHKEEWKKAYNAELDKLDELEAIKWIPKASIPNGTTIIPLLITYRIKHNEHGHISQFKCRCTARGDKQIVHEHYDPLQLSSAVASKDAIRFGLSLAAAQNLHAEHIDIESAFLSDILEDTKPIYVHQLPRFDGSYKYPNCVGILRRNIYGTTNACRIFTSGVANNLELMGFQRSTADACTFTLKDKDTNDVIILIITVDDFLTLTNNLSLLNKIKSSLKTKYKLKELGPVKHII